MQFSQTKRVLHFWDTEYTLHKVSDFNCDKLLDFSLLLKMFLTFHRFLIKNSLKKTSGIISMFLSNDEQATGINVSLLKNDTLLLLLLFKFLGPLPFPQAGSGWGRTSYALIKYWAMYSNRQLFPIALDNNITE